MTVQHDERRSPDQEGAGRPRRRGGRAARAGTDGASRPRAWLAALSLASMLVLGASCNGVDPGNGKGTISGTITRAFDASAAAEAPAPAAPLDADADFVPGELIVKFEPGIAPQSRSGVEAQGLRMLHARDVPGIGAGLYRRAGLSRARTLEVARALSARSDVAYAHPNYLLHPLVEPDDLEFARQWHYQAIGLPDAWDLTTGSEETVVAVVDTGILFAVGRESHPDFDPDRMLAGYDFISNADFARDGDGRDSDPFDEDAPGNVFHGTHVAGTIGADTNNGIGVAGVDWTARVLPIRALGAESGSLLDVFEGLEWAAGLEVEGVPPIGTSPATVANLSLGGPVSCPGAMQDFLDRVRERAIVVVAAGNTNEDAALVAPASCAGVLTVGASGPDGERAGYSNFGLRLDVMAPGGDRDKGDDAGVLSLSRNQIDDSYGYGFLQGTSMAAPHVAGLVALMKDRRPNLTTSEAFALLRATAVPMSPAACQGAGGAERSLTEDDCGAGIVDAHAAVVAAASGDFPGGLAFEPEPVDFGFGSSGDAAQEVEIALRNLSEGPLAWSIEPSDFVEAASNPGPVPADALYLAEGGEDAGSIPSGEGRSVVLGLDRSKLTEDGMYQVTLNVAVDGGTRALPVRFHNDVVAVTPLTGPMVVASFVEDAGGNLILSGQQKDAGVIDDFSFDADPGVSHVIAWSDENDDGALDEGDYFGAHPSLVLVETGRTSGGTDIEIERIVGESAMEVPEEVVRQIEDLVSR